MQIKRHDYEVKFNLIHLPQDSEHHAIDLRHHLYSGVARKDQYSLDSHTCVK